uniref:Uncharacterized protein n=1 Tax=Physcomitrium patens TaxID=3218 RepID=A0A2K1IDQ7_PHYPA|nr:hypothetical protein PHYPA_029555 [Physcomitrium patens]
MESLVENEDLRLLRGSPLFVLKSEVSMDMPLRRHPHFQKPRIVTLRRAYSDRWPFLHGLPVYYQSGHGNHSLSLPILWLFFEEIEGG